MLLQCSAKMPPASHRWLASNLQTVTVAVHRSDPIQFKFSVQSRLANCGRLITTGNVHQGAFQSDWILLCYVQLPLQECWANIRSDTLTCDLTQWPGFNCGLLSLWFINVVLHATTVIWPIHAVDLFSQLVIFCFINVSYTYIYLFTAYLPCVSEHSWK